MKTLFTLILISFNFSTLANVDEYQFCQARVDSIRQLSKLSINELTSLKKSIAIASSIEELNTATSKDFSPVVTSIQEHQKITKALAEKTALQLLKMLETSAISKAISLHGNENERIWSFQFDKCVEDNLD
ncbi:hypothetical protein V5096_06050 [Pseudoalteromonas carrageenovora]|uniref:hypothetical protein n=1 Tax=Pseudoalteromonas carrageenovora TaxID=227 RepID=UPI002FD3DC8B